MLFACPRCSQMLPTDAAFCRRCGSTVQFAKGQMAQVSRKSPSLLTPLLTVLLIGGVALAGLLAFRTQSVPTSDSPAVMVSQPYQNNLTLSQANRAQNYSQPPVYIPAQRIPMYSVRPPVQYHQWHSQNRQ